MQITQSEQTLVTFANGAELTRNIVQAVVGNDVANSLNGSPLTRQSLYQFSLVRFQAALHRSLGK